MRRWRGVNHIFSNPSEHKLIVSFCEYFISYDTTRYSRITKTPNSTKNTTQLTPQTFPGEICPYYVLRMPRVVRRARGRHMPHMMSGSPVHCTPVESRHYRPWKTQKYYHRYPIFYNFNHNWEIKREYCVCVCVCVGGD